MRAVNAEVPVAAVCLGCGYRLYALPESRCPECGRVFDPCNPSTFRTPRSRAWLSWTPVLWLGFGALVLSLALLGVFYLLLVIFSFGS